MILAPNGKPFRTPNSFLSTVWATREGLDLLLGGLPDYDTEARIQDLRESVGAVTHPAVGDTIRIKLPARFSK